MNQYAQESLPSLVGLMLCLKLILMLITKQLGWIIQLNLGASYFGERMLWFLAPFLERAAFTFIFLNCVPS